MNGEEFTKRLANQNVNDVSFWETVSNQMKDGELLHIAVQIGSLLGVKMTSWPGILCWRDGKNGNKTALEFSKERWGDENEITKYLMNETEVLVSSGFLRLE